MTQEGEVIFSIASEALGFQLELGSDSQPGKVDLDFWYFNEEEFQERKRQLLF